MRIPSVVTLETVDNIFSNYLNTGSDVFIVTCSRKNLIVFKNIDPKLTELEYEN